jgi:predicted small integral membrane protein
MASADYISTNDLYLDCHLQHKSALRGSADAVSSRFLGRRMEKHFSTQQSTRFRVVILACGKRHVRFAAFLKVGAEWFLMWQSKSWNGQESTFRDLAAIRIALPLVAEPDANGQP